MKRFAPLLALLAGTAFAGATYTSGGWQLVNTSGATDEPSYAACVSALKAQPLPSRQRTDYCREKWVTKVTADPPPVAPPPVVTPACTAPKPPDELKAMACPNTDTKWWNQERTYNVAPYPTCWQATDWAPTAPGPNDCILDPPPSGDVYASPPTADTSKLLPGQTLVLKAGTYTSLKLTPCKADAWCTVRAENDGDVTFTGLNIGKGNWYTTLEGLKFAGTDTKTITGSFVKIKRTAFVGGPATGNSVTLQIGTNDYTPGASDILLEDSWVYGPGGRYKVLVYNAQRVVLRRVIVRHDGGWKYDGQNPQGGIALYDSANVRAEDVACVDSIQGLDGFEACIYLVSNGTTSTAVSNVVVNGAIVIDSPNNGLAAEGNASGTWSVQDAAVLRSAAGGFNTNGKGNLTVTRAYANVKGAPFAAWNGSLKASGCIFKGGSNSGASLTNCSGTLPAAITAPNATGQGANLAFRIGLDGTLFGEPGFEDVTMAPLFPWPNEARMKADFDQVRPAFGGRSFTGYVQGATQ